MKVGRPTERLEDRAVEAGDVRNPEQVDRARRVQPLGRCLGEERRQRHHPRLRELPLRAVQRQPNRALPNLQRLVGLGDDGPSAPGGQHLGAGERVVVEQRAQLGRQLHPFAIEGVRGAPQIVTDGAQLGAVQPSLIVEQRQQRPLHEVPVDDCRVGRALGRDVAEKAAQKPGLDVGRDPQVPCQPLLDVPLDQGIRYDEGHWIEETRSAVADGGGQRLDQRLQAIRAAKPDHERLF